MARKLFFFLLIPCLGVAGATVAFADGASIAVDPPAQCSAGFTSGGDPAPLPPSISPPAPFWAGDCVRYSSCFCRCQYQGVCCRNGCWSSPNPSGCGNQCNDIEGACEDDCAAEYVSDGTVCPTISCSLNPFCNAP